MHFGSKGLVSLALIAAAAISSANLNYSNITATVTYNGGSAQDLTVLQDGNSITFMPPPPMIVGYTGGPTSAVVTISYDVTSSKGINGLDLIFTGSTSGTGSINFNETVLDGGQNVIASTSGTKSGDGGFVEEDFLKFSNGAETSYSVTKEFDLNTTNLQQFGISLNPNNTASIGLIEQNAVPEPVTLGAVGVGLVGLLARKRRK